MIVKMYQLMFSRTIQKWEREGKPAIIQCKPR